MMTEHLITVFTPTYNRAGLLPQLYESLCGQSFGDFEWLIVDDGSTDDTRGLVDGYMAEGKISIRYIYKQNQGKPMAINDAIMEAKGELFFIVDSDDRLTPDALQTIADDWNRVKDDGLCGIGYLRGYDDNIVIGDIYPQDGMIDTFVNVRYNRNINGDKAEVWVTECLKPNLFPYFEGEKFISESVMWIKTSHKQKMLFVNKVLYITQYHEGGLTKLGRKLRFQCPKSMAYGSLVTMTKDFSTKIRIKETLLYIVYSKFGKRSIPEIFDCEYKGLVALCLVPGLMLYWYWKRKYLRG